MLMRDVNVLKKVLEQVFISDRIGFLRQPCFNTGMIFGDVEVEGSAMIRCRVQLVISGASRVSPVNVFGHAMHAIW